MSTVSDVNRRAWLLLLSHGGWWSAGEVEAQLELAPGYMYQRLRRMKTHGSVMHRAQTNARAAQFAVTPACTVPQGMTIAEVHGALSDEPAIAAPSAPTPRGGLSAAELALVHLYPH